MRGGHRALWMFAAAGVLAALTPGRAEAESAAIVVAGDEVPSLAELRDAAERAVTDCGWLLATPHRDDARRASTRLMACAEDDASCRRGALAAFGADFALTIRVTRDPNDAQRWELRGRLLDTSDGSLVRAGHRSCAPCTADGVATAATGGLVRTLLRGRAAREEPAPAPPARARAPALEVSAAPTKPPPAESLPEGAAAGVSLLDAPPAEPDRFGAWKWAALGAGAVGVAVGATLIAIDGPRVEAGVRQRHERATLVPGIATAVAGAGLVGLGGWMWWRDGAVEQNGPELSLGAGRNGVMFVLTGELP